ncbi:MAG: PDZ domain-containing protein [Thiotrichaceae bacterium]
MKTLLQVAALTLPLLTAPSMAESIAKAATPTTTATSANPHGDWPAAEAEQPQTQPAKRPVPVAQAAPASTPRATEKIATKDKSTAGYLGIGLDVLPQSVVAQMPSGVSTGEGILVTRFADDSPAKKSGLRAYDILLSYDATKLIHPKQFIMLVRNDQPGREVKLKVLRNGEVMNHSVTLGLQKIPQAANGLSIKQLGKKLYLASIRFTDASGKQQLREYKGTRQEIYYQAQNARDLPAKDKEQVMYAAGGPQQKKSNNSWGSFMPFGNSNGNNSNGFGSFMPFGGNNNNGNSSFGSFFPFNR